MVFSYAVFVNNVILNMLTTLTSKVKDTVGELSTGFAGSKDAHRKTEPEP
jgi:hypothetical protein